MSTKAKFLSAIVANCALVLAFMYVATRQGWDMSKRLIDLNISDGTDLKIILVIVAITIGAVVINMSLFSNRRTGATSDDLVKVCREIAQRVH